MMFKKIIICSLISLLAACGPKPRAGSLYEQPEFMSLMPMTSWKKNEISHDFAKAIFSHKEGDYITADGEFLVIGKRYISALGMACQKFASQTTAENWVMCAENKYLEDAVVIRAF